MRCEVWWVTYAIEVLHIKCAFYILSVKCYMWSVKFYIWSVNFYIWRVNTYIWSDMPYLWRDECYIYSVKFFHMKFEALDMMWYVLQIKWRFYIWEEKCNTISVICNLWIAKWSLIHFSLAWILCEPFSFHNQLSNNF